MAQKDSIKILSGKKILHPDWPEAVWNVSGLFSHDALLLKLLDILEMNLQCPNPIGSVHGSPPFLWNSGRMFGSVPTEAEIDDTLQAWADAGIPVFFTFSNHLLEEKHLADPSGNLILEKLSSMNNNSGIIVCSELLSAYARKRYPKLKQIASIVKITVEKGKGSIDYYQKLLNRFDRVVLHPDDNLNTGLLQSLDKERIEILVNEPCVLYCANRQEHYNCISETGLDIQNPVTQGKLSTFAADVCQAIPFLKQIQTEPAQRNCTLSFPELKYIYDLGFRHFKLQGRNMGNTLFAFDVIRYLFEPDHTAPLLFRAL